MKDQWSLTQLISGGVNLRGVIELPGNSELDSFENGGHGAAFHGTFLPPKGIWHAREPSS